MPEALAEQKKLRIIETNDLVDGLARDHLINKTFLFGVEEEIAFPGEGGVKHYEMTFIPPHGISFTPVEQAKWGNNCSPGIRVVKALVDYNQPSLGWQVELQRVVLRDGKLADEHGKYESVSIDMQTGKTTCLRNGIEVDNHQEAVNAYRRLCSQLKTARGLIDAAFSKRDSGVTCRLKKEVS